MAANPPRRTSRKVYIAHDANMTALQEQIDRLSRMVDNTVELSTQQLITRQSSKHPHADPQQSPPPPQTQQSNTRNRSASKRYYKYPSPSAIAKPPPATPAEPNPEPLVTTMPTKPPSKKKVRFDPVARDESDEIYQRTPSPRFAEAKKRHAPRPKPKSIFAPFLLSISSAASKKKRSAEDPFASGFAIGMGLSSLAAMNEGKKGEVARKEKEAYSARAAPREKGQPRVSSGTREMKRKGERRVCEGVYVEKRPRVVLGDRGVLGDNDWAMVRKRTVVGYGK